MTPQLIKNIIDRNALFVSKIEFMVSKATRFTEDAKRQWDSKVQSLKDAITYLDSILLKNEVKNEEKQD